MRKMLLSLLLVALLLPAKAQVPNEEAVRSAVERQLACFPQSTLQDIYKSFFQDRFGPGHIVADTEKAIAYLRSELDVTGDSCVLLYEPTGCCGNYYRVSLAVIERPGRSGKVPFGLFADAFLRSVREVQPADVVAWRAEWGQIERIIAAMGLALPGYDADAAAIAALLDEGHYAVHHSRLYNEHYAPHYRIIAKDIFEAEILPLLE